MFEKTCDIFLQQANPQTPSLSPTEIPEFFKHLRRSRLQETAQDESSFAYFKEKLTTLEKTLLKQRETREILDKSKIIFPILGFSKIYAAFCALSPRLFEQSLDFFPHESFSEFFRYLGDFEEITGASSSTNFSDFFEESAEFLYELKETFRENRLIIGSSSLTKLFHHVLAALVNEKLATFAKKTRKIHEFLAEILVFLFVKTAEERDRTTMLDEFFARLQQMREKPLATLDFQLSPQRKISVFSYFLMEVPQQLLISARIRDLSGDGEDSARETLENATKFARNAVLALFRRSREDSKAKTQISRFLRVFLNDLGNCLENARFATIATYFQAFANIIVEFIHSHKSEGEAMYKSLLLELVKEILLNFLDLEQFFATKAGKFADAMLSAGKSQAIVASTSTKVAKNKEKTKETKEKSAEIKLLCAFCKENSVEDEDLRVISSDSQAQIEVCLGCYLQNVKEQLDLPRKPDFSFEKLWNCFENPLFLYILRISLDLHLLESRDFLASRQFLLISWYFRSESARKPYISLIKSQISSCFSEKTALSALKSLQFLPNAFVREFLWKKQFFSLETERISRALQSILLILSNESTQTRNKSLEVVKSLVNAHPAFIFSRKAEEIIAQRVLDNNSSVRTSALEIIMRFFQGNWVEESFFLGILLERLYDIDCGIRKQILTFFVENARNLNENSSVRAKIAHAAVLKLFDNEEIAQIAENLVLQLVFSTFRSEKPKKRAKAGKTAKNREKSPVSKKNVEENLALCVEIATKLDNCEWFRRVLKALAAKVQAEVLDQAEIRLFVEKLIEELSKKPEENPVSRESLTYLELLLSFSKHFPGFVVEELPFLTVFLGFLADAGAIIRKKDEKTLVNQLLGYRKDAISLLLEVIDAILEKTPGFDEVSASFLANMQEIEKLLIKFTLEEALEILHKALKLLISVVKRFTKNFFLIKNLYIQTYAFVLKKKASLGLEKDAISSLTPDNAQHFMRCLYILTFLTRYFDISEFFEENEQQKPEFQEPSLIKIIYNELILFCKYQSPIIAQTCIECILILCEKMPNLIFESRGFIESYLLDVDKAAESEAKREIIEKIYASFYNLLIRHEQKIKRQNSLKRQRNSQKLQKNQRKSVKSAENREFPSDSAESSEETGALEALEALESRDYEKIAGVIKEIAKNSFVLHVFCAEISLRYTILKLLRALVTQGHVSAYETEEFFLCFLCDSDQEIREFCQETLRNEWKSNRFAVVGALHQGIARSFAYLSRKHGKPLPFEEKGAEIASFFDVLQEISGKAQSSEEISACFAVILVENYALYAKSHEKEFAKFVCFTLLSLKNYNLWQLHEVLKRLFELISRNYYKSLVKIKAFLKENKEKPTEIELLNGFSLLIQLLTFHIFLIKNRQLRDLCPFSGCTPGEFLEKLGKSLKKTPYKPPEPGELLENKRFDCGIALKMQTFASFDEFCDKFLEIESFRSNPQENVYLLYKKLKFLLNYNVCEDEVALFAFQQEMLEKYHEENLWSKKKSKGKRAISQETRRSRPKNSKEIVIDEEKTRIFVEKPAVSKKKPKKRGKVASSKENRDKHAEIDEFKYSGRLRKRKLMNFEEKDEESE